MSTCPDDTDELEFLREFRQNLQEMRAEGLYCDAVLKAEGESFPCHRVVLAAASPYFKAMFSSGMSESESGICELQDVSSTILKFALDLIYRGRNCMAECATMIAELQGISTSVLESALDFIYIGKIQLDSSNIEDVLNFADMMQIKELRLMCDKYLCKGIDGNQCFQAYSTAKLYNLDQLKKESRAHIARHFKRVTREKDWYKLCFEDLVDILQDDTLQVENENFVFDALIRWVDHDKETRKHLFPKLLEFIRLPFCSGLYLSGVVARHPLMMDVALFPYIQEAQQFRSDVCNQHTMVSSRTKPRDSFEHHRKLLVIRSDIFYELDIRSYEWSILVPDAYIKSLPRFQYQCALPHGILFTSEKGNYIYKSNHAFERFPSFKQSSYFHGMVYHDSKLYVFGGATKKWDYQTNSFQTDVTSRVEEYDLSRRKWESSMEMPKALCPRRMVASYEQYIYIFGGSVSPDSGDFITNVYQFDTVHGAWHEKSPIPTKCDGGSVVSFNDDIFILGGVEDVAMKYMPSSDQWVLIKRPIKNAASAAAVVFNGKILLAGGKALDGDTDSSMVKGYDPTHYSKAIQEYDPCTDTWKLLDFELPEPLGHHMIFNVKA